MRWLCNALYLGILCLACPYLLYRYWFKGRYRTRLKEKLLGVAQPLAGSPVWFHGVSVGEIYLLKTIVSQFHQQHPQIPIVISSSTDTGLNEAVKTFPGHSVIAWPLDFSWAVRKTIRHVKPRLIVLAENELWPNFLAEAKKQLIPVCLVNGRMSPRSAKRFQALSSLALPVLFNKVQRFGMQTPAYARNLEHIGVPPARVQVTGSVKYDGALTPRPNPHSVQLRQDLQLSRNYKIWVAGSTHAPEEKICLGVYRKLREEFPELRLLLVPRSPDRFEAVARLIAEEKFTSGRRSKGDLFVGKDVYLVDTLGELAKVWGLADFAFVGGSFEPTRGGQSMIEPAANAVPVAVGPYTHNFRDAVARLQECGGLAVCETPEALEEQLRLWLKDPELASATGLAGRHLVEQQQGATAKTIQMIEDCLNLGGRIPQAA